MALATAAAAAHHYHQRNPAHLSTSPSLLEPQFRSQLWKRRKEPINPTPRSSTRGDSTATVHYSTVGRFSAASHGGRRGFALLMAISVAVPLHWSPEMVAAGQLSIVQSEVRKVLSKAKAAGVLRMAFHDAGTFDVDDKSGGMNGSIVYEIERPENAGLKKPLKVLEIAKREIDKSQQVSWADLIAVAGAEAVSLCGGPIIPVRLGRLDARMPDPEGKLPQETLDAPSLKKCFLKKGFSTQELVALSGAHTLGNKGFGSPVVFDNAYFKILLEKPWTSSAGMSSMIGLPSDRALAEDDECLRWIKIYAADQIQFFNDFRSAYSKLVDSGAVWRSA